MNRGEIVEYLKNLREEIIRGFSKIETQGSFERSTWDYQKGQGGGEISQLRGEVFEKAAVNWSGVGGAQFPMKDGEGPFFATGVSLITHMRNPKMPTVHFNIRYIETEKSRWLGGGFDLTPMGFPFAEDTAHFHSTAKNILDPFGTELYPRFSAEAKEYFTIPHYQRERGVGGIFFDHFASGDLQKDLKMWRAIGDGFWERLCPSIIAV